VAVLDLARIGGEEFAVALRGCDSALAVEILDRLRAVVPDEQTCSVGLAMRQPGESAESLVGRADRALYEAKREGRDRLRLAR
jgi:diguanylate cyclase (GGDEF)-like protein